MRAIPSLAIALAVFASLGQAACGGSSSSEPPRTIAEAARAGARIEQTRGDVVITATLPQQAQEEGYVSELGVLAKRTAQAIQKDAPDMPSGATTVTLLALRPDLDRLGNAGAHSFAMVTFDVADLKAAHVEKLGAYGVLDLAKEVRPILPWQLVIGNWCIMHDRAPNFCLLAHAGVGDGVPWNGPPGT
jgi:hypothetical protein